MKCQKILAPEVQVTVLQNRHQETTEGIKANILSHFNVFAYEM